MDPFQAHLSPGGSSLHWVHGQAFNSLVPHQHFRAAVLDSAAERAKHFARQHVGGSTKVDQLDVEVLVDDDVLVLDVAVDNVLAV